MQVFTLEMLKQYLDFFPKKLLKLQLFQMLFPDLMLEILFLLEYVKVENCLTLLHVGARSRLQHIQNNAARVVQQAWREYHIVPVLHELYWLPVTQRVLYNILTIVFNCLHRMTPVYLTELLHLYQPSRSLISSKSVVNTNTKNKLSQSR